MVKADKSRATKTGHFYLSLTIRSYLSTCRKHELSASEALRLLFSGKLPDFLSAR